MTEVYIKNMFTEAQIKAMKHCIGMDYKNPYKRHGKQFYRPWRNYYETGPGCDGHALWVDLGRRGYAKHRQTNNVWVYWLTRSGLDALEHVTEVRIYDAD